MARERELGDFGHGFFLSISVSREKIVERQKALWSLINGRSDHGGLRLLGHGLDQALELGGFRLSPQWAGSDGRGLWQGVAAIGSRAAA